MVRVWKPWAPIAADCVFLVIQCALPQIQILSLIHRVGEGSVLGVAKLRQPPAAECTLASKSMAALPAVQL